ncbi:major facilitator superfamily protein [Sphingobium sp. SYK-6]|uniref:spinster family MFS transporter n=1 Tax=Sphingobium sp. (strain NBRC 103272 / SYK-6) TaxID=627192 RepID=UPI00022775A2|nr:MFS transporter [Sphingobium sp. SYK-6]BAK67810.1 major facilitator superfamily protein [Sphingobium sp. SYK-6]
MSNASAPDSSPSLEVGAADTQTSVRAAWAVGFLTLVSTFNYLDRSLLGLLLPLIKDDLDLSDTALGLISGVAFGLVYALLCLPIASLADRSSRRNIITAGFALWSLMTALTGYAVNGIQLAICRLMMAAGEAAGVAPSQSMISDVVSRERRPFALAIFQTAFAIDAIVFLPLTAWIAGIHGWRAAFQFAGFFGLLLAIIFFLTVREPERRLEGRAERAPGVTLIQAMFGLWKVPAFRAMMLGVAFTGGALNAASAWTSALIVRVHGLTVTEVGLYVTPSRGFVAVFGILFVGWMAERLGRRDERWRFGVPALVCLIVAPAYLMFLLSDTRSVWIMGMLISGALHTAAQGPLFAVIVALSPENMKTVALAIKVFVANLLGQLCGPLAVGILNDLLMPIHGDQGIRYSMIMVAVCYLMAAICFLWAGRLARRDGHYALR